MLAALAAGFVAGVSSQPLWTVLPSWLWLFWSALPLLPALVVVRSSRWRATAWCALGCALGIGWSSSVAQEVLAARLPVALAGQDLIVDGELRAARLHGDGSATWTLAVGRLPWHAAAGRWQLRIGTPVATPWVVGERWRIRVRLKPPHATQNPDSADFERYLFGERVVATGYLRDSADNRRLAPPHGLAAWRQRMLDAALPLLGNGAGDLAVDDAGRFARAVLPALVLDERSWLTSAQWRVLANTGTAHLVAISGLHVALLWGAVLWSATLLLRRRAGSLRYRAVPVLSALAVATAYAALAGMPLPAVRATVMLAAASVLLLRDGRISPWRVLLGATAVVLLVDPLAVHAAGFWLSHGAVALLLLLGDLHRRRRALTGWRAHLHTGGLALRVQSSLSLLIVPLLFALFGTASVSGVFANLPAIPLVNLVALPAALAGFVLAPVMPAAADPCLDVAVAVLSLLWRMLAWIDGWPLLSPLAAPGSGVPGIAILLVALVMLVGVRNGYLRVAALLLAVLAWPVPTAIAPGNAEVCVLDVGQGLSVLARTARHALVYDTGPAWGADSDAGTSIVVPALRARGVRQPDLLLLSHHDLDHVGGAPAIVAAMRPRELLVGDPRSLAFGAGTRCDRERHWHWDGIAFRVLPGGNGSDNDRSCVLRIAAGTHAVLLPGDITKRRELALTAEFPSALRADVLVAAHHGSRSSGSATFLHRVAPRAMVYSAGYRNRFGHPHPATLATARRLTETSFLTATDGAVCFLLRPDAPPEVGTARRAGRRYWRD